MVSFTDTEIAFASKDDRDLKRAYWLFRAINNPFIVKTGNTLANIAFSLKIPIDWAIKPTLYKQFVGGETIEQCKPVVDRMGAHNVKSILDYSVEGKENDADIEAALQETLRTIENASREENIPFAVFKPTGFGKSSVLEKASEEENQLNQEERKEADKFIDRVNRLCKAAYEKDIPIHVDAEDACYQNFIDSVVTDMMEKYNTRKAIVFNTLQMYRWDRLDFLKNAYEKAREKNYYPGIKFVRGAYMEKERERAKRYGYTSPIHPTKEATDQDYNAALKFSVEHIDRISIFNATHNEYSSKYLTELMDEHGLAKDDPRIWFSQLYGMSDHISFNLAKEGYNVARYVPYGPVKHVLPYLLRRAEENTSVKGQICRELSLLMQEKRRREKIKRNNQ